MITFTITDNTGTKKQVSAPHSWSELTLQQVLDIENDFKQPEGLIKLFSIITGLNVVDISQSKDRSLYKKIRDICEFVVDPPEWKTIACPKHLEIGDKIYKVPQNVNTIMHGQIESLAAIENPFESAARVVSIIMAPEVYKEKNYGRYRLDPKGKFYDRDQVEELIPVIQNSRGTDCIGITSFFLSRLKHFVNIGMLGLAKSLKERMRKESYYTDWLKVKGYNGTPSLEVSK